MLKKIIKALELSVQADVGVTLTSKQSSVLLLFCYQNIWNTTGKPLLSGDYLVVVDDEILPAKYYQPEDRWEVMGYNAITPEIRAWSYYILPEDQ